MGEQVLRSVSVPNKPYKFIFFQFLIQRGNVTTYEWIHGEAPLTIEEPKLDFGDDSVDNDDDEGNQTQNVEIDFDLDFSAPVDLSGVELEAPVDIDWGDLEGGEDVDDVKIDWDAVDVVSEVQVFGALLFHFSIQQIT